MLCVDTTTFSSTCKFWHCFFIFFGGLVAIRPVINNTHKHKGLHQQLCNSCIAQSLTPSPSSPLPSSGLPHLLPSLPSLIFSPLLLLLLPQGRRKVTRSGAALYRGRAAVENFSSAGGAENFLTYPYFSPTKKQLS